MVQQRTVYGSHTHIGLFQALVALLGLVLLWFSVSDGWMSLLRAVGLTHELHRPRVYGDLALLQSFTPIVAIVLLVSPLILWRFPWVMASLSQRLEAFRLAAAQSPLSVPLLLITLVLVKTVLQLSLYLSGYVAYSADDFGRTLKAAYWLQHYKDLELELWLSLGSPWLPFSDYLFGLGLALHEDLFFTPKVINLILSGLAVFVVYRLGQELFGRTAGVLTAVVFAFLPWHLWLGMSGMTSDLPSVIMIALYGFLLLRWLQTDQPFSLLAAAACLFVADGLRYENWIFSGAFTLFLIGTMVWRWRQRCLTRQSLAIMVCALAIANAFPLIHMTASYVVLGDWLPALRRNINYVSARSPNPKIDLLLLAIVAFPFEFAFALGGIVLGLRSDRRGGARAYLLVLLITSVLFVGAFKGQLPAHGAGVARVLLPDIVLLLPYVGFLFTRLFRASGVRRPQYVLAACLLFLAMGAFNLARAANYRDTFPKKAIYAGWTIRHLQEMGRIPEHGRILIEENKRKHHGHLGIMVLANRPERFVRWEEGALAGACDQGFHTEACRTSMREGNFDLVILWSEDHVMDFQKTFGRPSWQIGEYHIFELHAADTPRRSSAAGLGDPK